MTAIIEQQEEQPKTFEVSFDGKQPFKGSAVVGAFTSEGAIETLREAVPAEVTDLVLTARELSTEEAEAFFEKLEGEATVQ